MPSTTEDKTFNVDLAKKILYQVINDPETHNQSDWFETDVIEEVTVGDLERAVIDAYALASDCGSTACVAGWATFLSGYTLEVEHLKDAEPFESILYTLKDEKGERVEGGFENPSIMKYGQKLLGISDDDAEFLFLHTSNENAVATLYLATLCGSIVQARDLLMDEFDAAEQFNTLPEFQQKLGNRDGDTFNPETEHTYEFVCRRAFKEYRKRDADGQGFLF